MRRIFFEKLLRITYRLYATFGAGNRAMRSIDPRPKCGGEKPHKGRRPTAVFWSPSRLLAAMRIQACYTMYHRSSDLSFIPFILLYSISIFWNICGGQAAGGRLTRPQPEYLSIYFVAKPLLNLFMC